MSGMNGIGGVGGHTYTPEVSAPRSAPTQGGSASKGSDPLEALQRLLSQVETSANTKAIPAHQNW